MPFMQCRHGVISMRHDISGVLNVNGREHCFDGGEGYIETDWESSFPSGYIWTRLSGHDGVNNISIMAMAADIPMVGTHFKGCIAIVCVNEREYRLATYNRAKILKYEKRAPTIRRGRYTLEINASPDSAPKLFAPANGQMSREIRESACCEVTARFFANNDSIFSLKDSWAGFEYVG